jgi:hypothetical protein
MKLFLCIASFLPVFSFFVSSFPISQKSSYHKKFLLQMNDPNMNIITKYKSFFDKENINEIMSKIKGHELSDIYINKNYPELVAVDIPLKDIPNDITNYHLTTDVNPLIAQQIVNKAFDNDVLVHFVDFNDANQVITWLSKIPDFIIPFFAFSLLFSFIRGIFLSFRGGPGQGSRNGFNQFGGGGGFPFNNRFLYLNVLYVITS